MLVWLIACGNKKPLATENEKGVVGGGAKGMGKI